jgi:AraC family transcriptional regulator, positive regulator of tynA and feaB
MLQKLPSHLAEIPDAARERIAGNMLDLVATAVLSEGGEALLSPPLTLARIKLWIETHLGEELSAEGIAGGCKLSVRHINRLFAREKTSVMHHVWERRLARCHSDLNDLAMRHRSISDIAFAWGFNDLSHFSRTYRARYGCTASEARLSGVSEK